MPRSFGSLHASQVTGPASWPRRGADKIHWSTTSSALVHHRGEGQGGGHKHIEVHRQARASNYHNSKTTWCNGQHVCFVGARPPRRWIYTNPDFYDNRRVRRLRREKRQGASSILAVVSFLPPFFLVSSSSTTQPTAPSPLLPLHLDSLYCDSRSILSPNGRTFAVPGWETWICSLAFVPDRPRNIASGSVR